MDWFVSLLKKSKEDAPPTQSLQDPPYIFNQSFAFDQKLETFIAVLIFVLILLVIILVWQAIRRLNRSVELDDLHFILQVLDYIIKRISRT